jgi:phosphoglycerate dehydrogenase-like enzyme
MRYRTDQLDEALPLANFLLAAPLTTETTALIDRRRCRLLKRGVGFINVGRAGLIEQDALVASLNDAQCRARSSTSMTPNRCRSTRRFGGLQTCC